MAGLSSAGLLHKYILETKMAGGDRLKLRNVEGILRDAGSLSLTVMGLITFSISKGPMQRGAILQDFTWRGKVPGGKPHLLSGLERGCQGLVAVFAALIMGTLWAEEQVRAARTALQT